jgi:hypothetical protein
MRAPIILLLLTLAACDRELPGTGTQPPADVATVSDLAGGGCSIEVATPPDEGAAHAELCTPLSWGSNPPSSGRHYPYWPAFRVYSQPVPWGFLVHGLEHGAVVIAHNCPGGCADQVAALEAMVAGLPTKPSCSRPPVIVTPDPTLDVPFAASAWGYTLRARCFDAERFQKFVERRANHGREYSASDCGTVDLESRGWCPPAP